MCRFINADGYVQTGQGVLDKNMFAYCLNNPINLIDSTGKMATAVIVSLIIVVAAAIAGGVAGYIISRKTNQNFYQQAHSNSQKNNANSQYNKFPGYDKDNSNSNKKSSKKTKNNSKTQSYSKNTYESEGKLKPQEIAMNVFIGATVGLAVGGAIVALGGVACSVYLGTAAAYGTISLAALATSRQVAAIGILAFNLEAMVFGPFYFVELEPIEWQND